MIGRRSGGGVVTSDASRNPAIAICKVRGIGVADRVKTSTEDFSVEILSLCLTPNRCSSSITSKPSGPYIMDGKFNKLWVPTNTCVCPASHRSMIAFLSASLMFRVIRSTDAPKGRSRAVIVAACCFASTVVGASTNI